MSEPRLNQCAVLLEVVEPDHGSAAALPLSLDRVHSRQAQSLHRTPFLYLNIMRQNEVVSEGLSSPGLVPSYTLLGAFQVIAPSAGTPRRNNPLIRGPRGLRKQLRVS